MFKFKNTLKRAIIVCSFILLFISCSSNPSSPNEKDNFQLITDTTGILLDIDGNEYQVIKLGNQWWMAENLKVMHYQNGDNILNVADNKEWSNLTTGAYCSYDNADSNIATYGLLYNWYAVDDSRKIAPEGWHVATEEEWEYLENYVGSNTGYKLKSTSGWGNNGNGNNESGFKALPGAYRGFYDGTFRDIGFIGTWWSATEYSSDLAWSRVLVSFGPGIDGGGTAKGYGSSVRCIKDQ